VKFLCGFNEVRAGVAFAVALTVEFVADDALLVDQKSDGMRNPVAFALGFLVSDPIGIDGFAALIREEWELDTGLFLVALKDFRGVVADGDDLDAGGFDVLEI